MLAFKVKRARRREFQSDCRRSGQDVPQVQRQAHLSGLSPRRAAMLQGQSGQVSALRQGGPAVRKVRGIRQVRLVVGHEQ